MAIAGTYPMLFAFFDAAGKLRRDAFERQIEAALASGASGVAVLGLATEVSKLGTSERRQAVESVIAAVRGRAPVAVTIADGNVPDMIESARATQNAGAAWLILQPPRPPASGDDLIRFFGAIADSVSCQVGIQNAPEFLGIGLTPAQLLTLSERHQNVTIAKAECTAVAAAELVNRVGHRMRVFNGRAGLELVDNYRAGIHGMIPGVEVIDLQVAVEKAMRAGDEAEAERHYARMLPAVTFAMQGIAHLVLYAKLLAAHRLGIAPSHNRHPADTATEFGIATTRRLADRLGPLPGARA
jgi:4-hydroxy-tetrahydrodipicolinate synthase